MIDLIKEEIQNLKTDIPKIATLSEEYLFALVCFKYFYNDGRLDYRDYADTFVDGRDDGGIDLITTSEDDNQDRLVMIQGKSTTKISNKQDVVDVFTKMDQTFRDFQDYKTAQYNARLKRIFKEKMALLEDQAPTYELVLFINANPDEKRREEINSEIERIDELGKYQITIIYRNQIIEQVKSVNEPRAFVHEGKIKISKSAGVIKFGENGLLVNLSALSLKDLYDLYRDKGLFEQNFRYFVRNKRIDESINDSLKSKRERFWFLNNGIIIGCKDFKRDGDVVTLYDFSVINGCQTTTLIGEYEGKNENDDFVIPCKIVKPLDEKDFGSFIAEIAESSNSQKPISDRDLKANKSEQRNLQRELAKQEPKVYLEIKRGEQLVTSAKKKQLEPWQYLKNDYYGQVLLSFHFQSPGTARTFKKRIFSEPNVYARIFRRPVDKSNVVDLLKLDDFYTAYLNTPALLPSDPDQESVARNGRFTVLAIIGFMLKAKRRLIDLKKISNDEAWEKEISQDNLTGALFATNLRDDFSMRLNSLFSDIVLQISDLYKVRETEEKAVSNFFKSDAKYRSVILKHVVARYYQNQMRAKERDSYLEIFV